LLKSLLPGHGRRSSPHRGCGFAGGSDPREGDIAIGHLRGDHFDTSSMPKGLFLSLPCAWYLFPIRCWFAHEGTTRRTHVSLRSSSRRRIRAHRRERTARARPRRRSGRDRGSVPHQRRRLLRQLRVPRSSRLGRARHRRRDPSRTRSVSRPISTSITTSHEFDSTATGALLSATASTSPISIWIEEPATASPPTSTSATRSFASTRRSTAASATASSRPATTTR